MRSQDSYSPQQIQRFVQIINTTSESLDSVDKAYRIGRVFRYRETLKMISDLEKNLKRQVPKNIRDSLGMPSRFQTKRTLVRNYRNSED